MTTTYCDVLASDWKATRKIDAHMHVPGPPDLFGMSGMTHAKVVESADRLGIDEMWVSVPISGGAFSPIEDVRRCNDCVLEAMRQFPDRFIGYCFVIPGCRESLDEIERCLDAGMSGIKLYNQYKYSEPVLDPIAEKAIEHSIPILGHAGHICDMATLHAQPRTSDAADFVALAKRYPEVMLIEGHISGGGDWEWSVRELRDTPNVYLDTSGSNVDDRTIEMCVDMLGAERVLFATDMSMEGCIGKIISAELTDEQFEMIWWKNMQGIRDRRK